MTTVADAVEDVRLHLMGMHRPEYNTLDGAYTAEGTSLVFNLDTTGITTGSYVAVDEEILVVLAVNHTTKTATVKGAMLGSTAANHADGALVEINPRFPTFAIVRALKQEIASWNAQLFKTASATIPADTTSVVDVSGADGATFLLDARADDTDDLHPYQSVRIVRGMTASGVGVQAVFACSYAITATLAVPMDVSTFALTTDLEDTVGVPASAVDIPPLGAAWRLLLPREVKRTFIEQQGDARSREEVPPGHILQTGGTLKRIRDLRLGEEATRLRSLYPYLNGGT